MKGIYIPNKYLFTCGDIVFLYINIYRGDFKAIASFNTH